MSQFGTTAKSRDVRVVSEMRTTTDIGQIVTPAQFFSVSARFHNGPLQSCKPEIKD